MNNTAIIYRYMQELFDCGEAKGLYLDGDAISFSAGDTHIRWEGKSGISVYRWPDADRMNIRQVTLDRDIGEIEGDIKDHIALDLCFSRMDGDRYLVLYRCICRGGTVEIPGSVSFPTWYPPTRTDEMPVAVVTGDAFAGNGSVREIILGEGIESIEYAVRDCPALQTVLLPDSFCGYDMLGVSDCPAFRGFRVKETNPNVHMDNGCLILRKNARLVSEAHGEIREYTSCRLVCGCYGQAECTVSDGVEVICADAFYERTGLERVIVPDSVTDIGDEAFFCCPDLREVYLPRKLIVIGEKAFCGCEKLEKVEMPEELDHIGMGAFWECGALEEPDIPDDAELFSNDYSVKLLFGPDPELNRW